MNLKDFNPNSVSVDSGDYFGMPFSIDEARVVLVSAPWDVTVSYGCGAADAPDAIIEASTQLDFYDPSAPNAWREGIATAEIDYTILEMSQRLRADAQRVIEHLASGGNTDDDYVVRKLRRVNEGSQQLNTMIYEQCSSLIKRNKIVGLVGGDHSTPYGAIRAVAEHHDDFGILHIDAHCDLREAYEGFEYSHASIMYNIIRDFKQATKLVQVGVRDFCDDELEMALASDRIDTFADNVLARDRFNGATWAEQCQQIIKRLPQKVYVSFDIDGLEPSCCPHTGTPVPGGLTYNEAVYMLEALVESGREIVGFDVVEVAPFEDERIDAIVGARILYKLSCLTIKSQNK